ncbi:MAG: MtrAB system accessory lipoprotein LpqB [Corynebacterium glucuronolyticum]|nr:MtrAB system accessory lipoprotein LpqB [Mycobacteriaceae bacterium]MDY5833495.1 MtrAB system accessory lipoprotein LpqB [Corynebacterium glucuronolyticum]
MSRRTQLVGVLSAVALAVSGCATLPGDSEPQVLRQYERSRASESPAGPEKGQEADLLLKSFFTQSVNPTQTHQAARLYLTPEAAAEWDDSQGTTILRSIEDISSTVSNDPNRIVFTVRGEKVGRLTGGGVYELEDGHFEEEYKLVKVDGEWRIEELPAGVVLERSTFRNSYQPYDLYFFEPTGRMLVSDRRWVYNQQTSVDSTLIRMLTDGPRESLKPGVITDLKAETVYSGTRDGVHVFTGVDAVDDKQLNRIAAQVVWTLESAKVQGPYRLEIDGVLLEGDGSGLTTEDFTEYNPQGTFGAVNSLYALTDGKLHLVTADSTTPVNNGLSGIESASIASSSGFIAAVTKEQEDKSVLRMGPLDGPFAKVLEAQTLSRPSFEYGGSAMWTVVDGKQIVRVTRSSDSGELSQAIVQATPFDELDKPISVLRVSTSGVRVAAIVDNHVYVGTVARPTPGERRIANVREIAPGISGAALSLDWQYDGSLLVGTNSPDSPVVRIEPDGAAVKIEPSVNLTAPVVAVASTSSTMFVTDVRSMRQLPNNSGSSAFWREVPGLQSRRAAPIVPE